MTTTGPSPDGDGTLLNAGGKIDSASLQELYEKRSDDDDAPISATFTLSRDLAKRLDTTSATAFRFSAGPPFSR